VIKYPLVVCEWQECITHIKVKINGLLPSIGRLRQMLKCEQRLFKALYRFSVRRAHSRFATGLTTVY
jgi:hypothetical protein